ncbi:MAG TPA: hypothetical protein VKT28_07235, partial [Puia sp.]|nr:hypothetical protein [Puia sp.]
MKYMHYAILLLTVFTICGLCSCNQQAQNQEGYNTQLSFSPGDEKKIMEAFLSIKDSTEIYLKEGNYKFD